MLAGAARPTVFAGGLAAGIPPAWRERIDLRPPAQRGDLDELATSSPPGTALLVEGLFGTSLAVTPHECRSLIERGWQLCGAASMGALRASELWPVGMVGLGDVYAMYRIGRLRSDADVSVCYNPINWEEVTVSLVHVRAVLGRAEADGHIGGLEARTLLARARSIHWTERAPGRLLDAWRECKAAGAIGSLLADPASHPKRRDSNHALAVLLSHRWPGVPRAGGAATASLPVDALGSAQSAADVV